MKSNFRIFAVVFLVLCVVMTSFAMFGYAEEPAADATSTSPTEAAFVDTSSVPASETPAITTPANSNGITNAIRKGTTIYQPYVPKNYKYNGGSTPPATSAGTPSASSAPVASTTQNSPSVVTEARSNETVAISRDFTSRSLNTVPATSYITEPAFSEETTEGFLDTLDILEQLYAYDNTFYFQEVVEKDGSKSAIIQYYIGTEDSAEIPSEIEGKTVRYIGSQAFQSKSMSSVTIPTDIDYIDPTAFTNTLPEFTIYGYPGTTAQYFAEENGFAFSELTGSYEDIVGNEDDTAYGDTTDADDEEKGSNTGLIIAIVAVIAVAGVVTAVLVIKHNRAAEFIDDVENDYSADSVDDLTDNSEDAENESTDETASDESGEDEATEKSSDEETSDEDAE